MRLKVRFLKTKVVSKVVEVPDHFDDGEIEYLLEDDDTGKWLSYRKLK